VYPSGVISASEPAHRADPAQVLVPYSDSPGDSGLLVADSHNTQKHSKDSESDNDSDACTLALANDSSHNSSVSKLHVPSVCVVG
jgi:hypothetical protein